MLQATAAAIIWNLLAIGEVDATILDCGSAGVDILHHAWTALDHVSGLGAECTSIGLLRFAEEG